MALFLRCCLVSGVLSSQGCMMATSDYTLLYQGRVSALALLQKVLTFILLALAWIMCWPYTSGQSKLTGSAQVMCSTYEVGELRAHSSGNTGQGKGENDCLGGNHKCLHCSVSDLDFNICDSGLVFDVFILCSSSVVKDWIPPLQ